MTFRVFMTASTQSAIALVINVSQYIELLSAYLIDKSVYCCYI